MHHIKTSRQPISESDGEIRETGRRLDVFSDSGKLVLHLVLSSDTEKKELFPLGQPSQN